MKLLIEINDVYIAALNLYWQLRQERLSRLGSISLTMNASLPEKTSQDAARRATQVKGLKILLIGSIPVIAKSVE
jgi:hypothetical protein